MLKMIVAGLLGVFTLPVVIVISLEALNELIPVFFYIFLYSGPAISILMFALVNFWVGGVVACIWLLLMLALFIGIGRHG